MTSTPVATGVTIEYETTGDPGDPALLLIAGFGTQLIGWEDGFVRGLADGGRHVIRYDNRDAGLSTRFDQDPVDLMTVVRAAMEGDLDRVRELAPYDLTDLAADAAALLDALGLEAAHVVGSSMGGLIAQLVAIRHPGRVLTLTSVMSSTGEPGYGASTPEAATALFAPSSAERERYIADRVARTRVWSSRAHFDETAASARAAAVYDRAFHPAGTARHLAALLATGSLADDLVNLDVPTLVIHGTDDTLVTPSGGQRTAELIPGAELLLVDDMGHDRPEPLWPALWAAILDHTAGDGAGRGRHRPPGDPRRG